MTFHQKNSSYIARKIHDFRSLRYQSFFFFLPIYKDFFNRLYVHLYLHSQTEHISFVWRIKKWKKKKDAYRFKKCITHSTRGHCVPRHVTRTEKSRTSTDVAKKKKKKETKESRHQRVAPSRIPHLRGSRSTGNRVPPPPRPKRRESLLVS